LNAVPRKSGRAERIRDTDLLVATRGFCVNAFTVARYPAVSFPAIVEAGQQFPRDHPLVEPRPECFVPVVPPGVRLEKALRTLATMRNTASDGSEEVVYAGQLVAFRIRKARVRWKWEILRS
jgi:hypothetical protein